MPANLAELINIFTKIIILGTPTFLVLLFFVWNLSQVMFSLGDAEKMKQARSRVIWSVIALFVLLSLGGLVAIINETFFPDTSTDIQYPNP
jgi:multisubunit Na+/H+ antiporter MnhB subunit